MRKEDIIKKIGQLDERSIGLIVAENVALRLTLESVPFIAAMAIVNLGAHSRQRGEAVSIEEMVDAISKRISVITNGTNEASCQLLCKGIRATDAIGLDDCLGGVFTPDPLMARH